MMELEQVTKVYQQGRRTVNALCGISLTIRAGEFVSIMGPSGSGKSTLMHLLGALDTPTSGRVSIAGQDLAQTTDRQRADLRRTRIGFVFQFFNLLPTLTAAENVALPLLLAGQNRRAAQHKAAAALERVGLGERASHFPEEMAGGQMQRVAIARALVTDPPIVLCDEPTGNLDSANGQAILAMLRELPANGKRAVVMVTHDSHAAQIADRLIRLADGLLQTDEALRNGTPTESALPTGA